MMEQVIKLAIKDQTITKLAGYVLGRDLFQKQVEGKVDLNKAFTIEFPPQIDFLASSFIQGFFGEINRAIFWLSGAREQRIWYRLRILL